MTPRHLCMVLAGVLLTAFAVAATANVVTVSPDNPGDWTWLLIKGGTSSPKIQFTDGGPAPAEGNPFPTGNGAFCAYLSDNGNAQGVPDHVWLGLDWHNGQTLEGIPLNKITKLQYVAYNSGDYNVGYLTNNNPRRFPWQPFQVTLTVKCPTTSDRRHFIFRPWGLAGWQHWNLRRAWVTYDAIAMTRTPDFGIEMSNKLPVWYEPTTAATFSTWSALLSTDPGGGLPPYSEWTLVPTSIGWNPDPETRGEREWMNADYTEPRATATGKCLNLQVGARGGTSAPYSGVWEGAYLKGYVDTMTLGVNYGSIQTPNIAETTYDFASSDPYVPHARTVTIAGNGTCWTSDPPPPLNYPYATVSPIIGNQGAFTFRWFGKVLDMTSLTGKQKQFGPGKDSDTGEFYFTIWDGSYAPVSPALSGTWYANHGLINVRLPYQECKSIVQGDTNTYPVQVGDYVSVTGCHYPRFYLQYYPPLEIACSTANVVKYSP